MTLDENTKAPDFSLVDQNGKLRQLSDYKGKDIVLYFYPKDDTSGCTTEACAFRDDYDEYKKADVEIIGVSPDPQKSHEKFANKYELPFTLLADTDHAVCEAYGVWGKKQMYGKEYFGVLRTTFLINKEGNIIKVFNNVKPNGHSVQVLAALNE